MASQHAPPEPSTTKRKILELLLPLFKQYPRIDKYQISYAYNAAFPHDKLSVKKKFGYKNLDHMYTVLDVFNNEGTKVSISRPKLLALLLQPLLQEPQSNLEASFQKLNGFKFSILCEYCDVSSPHDLLKEVKEVQSQTSNHPSSSVKVAKSMPSNTLMESFPFDTTPHIRSQQPQKRKPHLFPPTPQFYCSAPITGNTAVRTSQPQIAPGVPVFIPPPPAFMSHAEQLPSHYPDPQIHPRDEIFIPPLPGYHQPHVLSEKDIHRPPVRPQFKRSEDPQNVLDKIEMYIQTFASYFSKQGKHLPAYVVNQEVKSICSSASKQVGRHVDFKSIKFSNDFDKLQKRLNEFMCSFCWNCPITSLFELQRTICELEKVADFKEFKIGPIVKHPEVIRLFKVPEDVLTVPEITAYDIHTCLTEYITKNKTNNVEQFMTYMAEKFSVSSPLHLCVRISSFPLACSINHWFLTSQNQIHKRIEKECEKKIGEDIDFEIKQLRRSLSRMSDNIKELTTKDPLQLIERVFNSSLRLFQPYYHSNLTLFFDTIMKNASLRQLFTIALYQGAYGVQKIIQEQETQAARSGTSSFTVGQRGQHHEMMVYKSQRELIRELVHMLRTVPFPIDLETLAELEIQLVNIMGGQTFHSFGHGPFLKFISCKPTVLEALGGKTIGSSGGEQSKELEQKRTEVISCIQQLKESSNKDVVSATLLQQFQVDSISQLGCGTLEKLISNAQNIALPPSSSIYYITPLLLNSNDHVSSPHHGVLGPQTRQDALDCLLAAPLLADLAEWSNWDLVFRPSLGCLSVFLNNQLQTTSRSEDKKVFALEIGPGRLLKINANSTIQDFTAAVDHTEPVTAAGHLVSLAVKASNISNVSTQLLAQHVHTKLSRMSTAMDCEGEMSPDRFVFNCLVSMPLQLCVTLGKQVFLDPLRNVTSSTLIDGLITLCRTNSERAFFQSLGMKLGIKAWIDDFKEMQTTRFTGSGIIVTKKSTMKSTIKKMEQTTYLKPDIIPSLPNNTPPLKEETIDEVATTDDITPSPEMMTVKEVTKVEEKCKKIILDIRQNEFGVGLELQLNPQQKQIAEKQKEREGRSLQRLSEELYSKDTHFVLELVQNADDNMYSSNQLVPTLKFVLSKDCITVLNNETGFLENNIRAICDVGISTKDRSRLGYIGQKGIGFKSVFRVTEHPEIHSRGFHIKFDTQSGPIGYILPQWVEHSFSEGKLSEEELAKWTTRIVLPLKSDITVSQNMMNKFQDIQPSLLLFLNRLRCIIIEDTETQNVRLMKRHDKSAGITEIRHDRETDHWLVVRKVLKDASQYKPDVEATELALAFPLPKDLKNPPTARELQSQQVFAFLPLRSYGFHFIIQGDFDLPSSREDVNSNSAWNQWLREEIPALFLKAIENFKALPDLSEIEAMSLLLQFIPLEGEVHDFFQPVTGEIIRLFKGKECLPTDPTPSHEASPKNTMRDIADIFRQTSTRDDTDIQWKQPSQLLSVHLDIIREYIPQSLLTSALNLYYLNGSLSSTISNDLCSQLNIGVISIDHLLAVAEYALKEYKGKGGRTLQDLSLEESKYFVKWIAHWLACVHSLMEDTRDFTTNTLSKLKRLPIIPLSNGDMVSIESGPIFFPPDSYTDLEQSFQIIYKELHTIDNELLNSGDEMVSARVYKILSIQLGVKELNIVDIIYHHIIPQFKKDSIMSKKDQLLISYLAFIKHSIDKGMIPQPQLIADLKDDVVLITNKGRKKPSKEVIHFDAQYKNQWNLSRMFPSVKWIEVSPEYLKISKQLKILPTNWKEFFLGLGVQSGLAVERINREINPTEEASYHIWDVQSWKRSPDGSYIVQDYYCKEFNDILASISKNSPGDQIEQMRDLAEMLDQCWDSVYKSYMMATYYDGSNSHELGNVVSSFGHTLTNKAWLPSVDLAKKPYSNDGSSPLLQGNQLYQAVDKLKHLLHCHVPYLGANLRSYGFIQHLQVRIQITSMELLDYLHNWSKIIQFRTTIEHMKHVYMFLARAYEEKYEIERAFSDRDLIFVPSITEWRNKSSLMIDGAFVSVHKTCWADKTTVLYKCVLDHQSYPSHLPQILSFFYGGFDDKTNDQIKNAFTQLGVRKDMNLENLISVFEFNASLAPSPEDSHIDAFRSIAEVILKVITNDESSPELKKQFFLAKIKEVAIFPGKGKKWVPLDGLFIDDDPEISKYFLKHEKVHFLRWPSKRNVKGWLNDELPNKFTEICLIPRISEHVRIQLNPSSIRPYLDIKQTFHYMICLTQKYILSRVKDLSSFNYHQEIAELLKSLQFQSTIELTCTYSIDEKYFAHASIKQCRFDDDPSQPVVYVVVNKDSKILEKSSLSQVISQIVLPNNIETQTLMQFQHFVEMMLMDDVSSEEDAERFVERYGLKPVPTDLPQWSIALPDMPKPPQETVELEPLVEETDLQVPIVNKGVPVNSEAGLRAWPPKAPVRMDGGAKNSTRSRAERVASNKDVGQERKLTERDVITVDEVQRMQQEAGQEIDLNIECKPATKKQQPSLNQYDAFNEKPGTISKSQNQTRSHSLVSQQIQPSQFQTTASSHQKSKQSSSSTLSLQQTLQEEKVTSTKSTKVLASTKAENKTKPSNQVTKSNKQHTHFIELQSIDITSLMKSLPIRVDRQLEFVLKKDGKEEVGKWGEAFIYNVLRHHRKLPNGVEIKSIIWLNEDKESGLPYDIKVISAHDEIEYYIEVKSTISVDRALIPISWKELQFAQQVKETYLLLRVYGVGGKVQEIEIKWLSDVFNHIESNPSITLYLKL